MLSFLTKHTVLLAILLSLALHVAVLAVRPLPKVEDWYDGLTYIHSPCNYFAGEFDSFRTPVYPWFIRLVQMFSPEMETLPAAMAFAQIACFLASIPVFYFATKKVVRSPIILTGVTFFYALSLQLCYWNFIIHTEALSVVGMVVFYYLILAYIAAPGWKPGTAAGGMLILLVLLRPSFIYLMPLLLCFWALRLVLDRRETAALAGLAATLCSIAVLGGYCEANRRQTDLFTISTVSLINRFDDMIDSGLYLHSAFPEMEASLVELVRQYSSGPGFHGTEFRAMQERGYTLSQIDAYVSQAVKSQPGEFFRYKLRGFLPILRSPFFLFFLAVGLWELGRWVYLWVAYRTVPWARVCMWGAVYGAFCVAAVGGGSVPEDGYYFVYQRLITPILPIFYAILAVSLGGLLRRCEAGDDSTVIAEASGCS